eukprot:663457-Prymnesium_polylepis.1
MRPAGSGGQRATSKGDHLVITGAAVIEARSTSRSKPSLTGSSLAPHSPPSAAALDQPAAEL